MEEEINEEESARGRPMMSGKADCNGRQSGRTISRGYRLMASTDGGGVNVTADCQQENKNLASERTGRSWPEILSRELWELDPFLLLFICVPFSAIFYMSII